MASLADRGHCAAGRSDIRRARRKQHRVLVFALSAEYVRSPPACLPFLRDPKRRGVPGGRVRLGPRAHDRNAASSTMRSLLLTIRRLLPGLALIGAAAAVLLWSDRGSRLGAGRDPAQDGKPVRLALLKHSSSQVMDEMHEGFVEGLAARGWNEGARYVLEVFNAQGDLPTGNTMASRLAAGDYRLVTTISTPMLQAFANANRAGRATHLFLGVSSPVDAGVGVARLDSVDKPAWMAGIGSAQPVEAVFREAKRQWPGLATVGVVWNAAEVNSQVCTRRARAVSAELGLTLLEAPIDSSQGVREAAESLVARGAEAIWTGGDATVVPAIDSLVAVAAKAGIPVFSNMAGQVHRGTTLDLGADYKEVGREAGGIAADLLEGASPAAIPVRNFMPERLLLNAKAAAGLRPPFVFDEETRARADGMLDAAGTWSSKAPAEAPRRGVALPGPKPKKIALVMYLETASMEGGLEGFREALAEDGVVEGRDVEIAVQSAQGDMAILSGLVDGIAAGPADLVVAFSTPALQTVLQKVKVKPAVFGIVADPFAAGAGRDDAHHLPGITGVYMSGPFRETAALLKRHFPSWKKVGTLFCPAETNSVANEKQLRVALAGAGIELDSIAAPTPADLPDSASALASRNIDAIVQISDNLSVSGFPAIARAAVRGRKPLVAFTTPALEQGAAVAVAMDYHEAGKATARMALRVLAGESPAAIPFENFPRWRLMVREEHARGQGFELPAALVAEAAAAGKDR
jgi:ABC-type uncharacterized transport system substrate-binding protein